MLRVKTNKQWLLQNLMTALTCMCLYKPAVYLASPTTLSNNHLTLGVIYCTILMEYIMPKQGFIDMCMQQL